jgi:hypothetical protein
MGLGTFAMLPFVSYDLSAVFCGGVPAGITFFLLAANLGRAAR